MFHDPFARTTPTKRAAGLESISTYFSNPSSCTSNIVGLAQNYGHLIREVFRSTLNPRYPPRFILLFFFYSQLKLKQCVILLEDFKEICSVQFRRYCGYCYHYVQLQDAANVEGTKKV